MFDPYHKWLGIPKGQQPPTHYQLLGVVPDETDPEVIEEMAIRQTSHVRTYQMGPHAAECARLLGEIALARRVLLDPERRRDYDAQLGDAVAAGGPAAAAPVIGGLLLAAAPTTAAPGAVPEAPALAFDFEALQDLSPAPSRRSRRRGRANAGLLALAVTALLVGGGVAALWRFGPGWRELSAAWYDPEPTAGAASIGAGDAPSRPAAPSPARTPGRRPAGAMGDRKTGGTPGNSGFAPGPRSGAGHGARGARDGAFRPGREGGAVV